MFQRVQEEGTKEFRVAEVWEIRWKDVRGGNGGREEEEEGIVKREDKVMIDQKQVRKSIYRRERELVGGK